MKTIYEYRQHIKWRNGQATIRIERILHAENKLTSELRGKAVKIAKGHGLTDTHDLTVDLIYRHHCIESRPTQKEIARHLQKVSTHAKELRKLMQSGELLIRDRLNSGIKFDIDQNGGKNFMPLFFYFLDGLGELENSKPSWNNKESSRKMRLEFYDLLFENYSRQTGYHKPTGNQFISFCRECHEAVGEYLDYKSIESYIMKMQQGKKLP